jgi:hypothetical protein
VWKPTPEETFVWVVTKTDMRWVRSDLGTPALTREVAALRCGLDGGAWEGDGAAMCADLLGIAADTAPKGNAPLPFDTARAHALYKALLGPVEELIRHRVAACTSLGCDGIIASPADVPGIRRLPDADKLLVVTPGVRLPGAALDDQKRTGTPAEAIAAGADYLVVGRPIVRAGDPAAMAARIVADMAGAA